MNPENPVNPACPVALVDGTGVRNISLAEKTIEDVLKHFGKKLKDARQNYHRNSISTPWASNFMGVLLGVKLKGDTNGFTNLSKKNKIELVKQVKDVPNFTPVD